MDSVCKRIVVTGRVQGVGFRYATAEQAGRLRLAGYVRNTPDGNVEIVAQGPAEAVDALIDWCRRGPPSARVRGVVVEDATGAAASSGFRISG